MCKMMDKALDNVFGMENTISEIDSLVLDDEEIIYNHNAAKDRRAARFERNKDQKGRNKRLYDPSNVSHWGKKAAYNEYRGITPVFHGENEPVAFIKKNRKNGTKQTMNKVANRKVRHKKFLPEYNPVFIKDVVDPVTGEIIAEAGDYYFDIEFFDVENWVNMNEYIHHYPRYYDGETITGGNWVPRLEYDNKAYHQLCIAATEVEWYKELRDLELKRAELMSMVHAVDWEIRHHIANRPKEVR